MNHLVCILASAKADELVAIAAAHAIEISVEDGKPLPKSFVWMPAGRHEIQAGTIDESGFMGAVTCDEQAFRAIKASFDSIKASGKRVWLDFNHKEDEASAWVKDFTWEPSRGIIAHVDWTADGEAKLRGKSYHSFSPAFAAQRETGRVVSLLANGHAAGGLVNAPAFGAMPALIAARAAGSITNKPASGGNPEEHQRIMKDNLIKLLAALKVKVPADATEDQLLELFAKHSEGKEAEIATLKSELAAVQAHIKAEAEKKAAKKAAKEKEEAEIQAKAAADAKAKADKEAAEKQAAELAEIKASLAAIRAGATAAGAGPGIVSVTASVEDVLRGYALLNRDPKARGQFYKQNVAPVLAKMGGRAFSEILDSTIPVLARHAEVQASNSLGSLSGNLIAQQFLALLKYKFPLLHNISTDFSNLSVKFNQTVYTRLIAALSASQYSGGSSGYTATSATATDVPVTINHHPYCQVAFDSHELASTNRDLFTENSEAVLYALGLDIIGTIYGLITSSNYTTTVLKLASGTDGTTYSRADAIKAAKALYKNKVPDSPRFNLVNADAYAALMSDSAVVSFAAYQKTDIITGYKLPFIADMDTFQAVNLPTTGGMVGFAAHPRALAIATRVPNDYTQAQGIGVPGVVSIVTDPDTGISVMVTRFVDLAKGVSNYRVEIMYGAAVGDPLAGIITEAANGS